ncbi:hypothetical protein H4S08_004942 [Coemansia sp. RSA 1365]|nr:hypothetical protein H4S08_004942 [Coemansia sp. RSA 1365]
MERALGFDDDSIDERLRYFTYIPKDVYPEVAMVAKNKVLGAIFTTTVLIFLRSIYRIAEFADGYGGKIYSSEWAFYVFDAIMIFLAFVVYVAVFIAQNFTRQPHGTSFATETGNAPAAGSSMHLVDKDGHPQPSV